MGKKITQMHLKPINQVRGVLVSARLEKSNSALEASIVLEINGNVPNSFYRVNCPRESISTMGAIIPKLEGARISYEHGEKLSPYNEILGEYRTFTIDSGQFKGACFP